MQNGNVGLPDDMSLTMSKPAFPGLANLSVILVNTVSPGNVGSIARVMKNLGFQVLKLVTVNRLDDEECRRMAGRAFDLIQGARRFNDLSEATADEQILFGTTSGRERLERGKVLDPFRAAHRIREYAPENRIGLVFGPERSGLSEQQLARCQFRVSIPSNPEYPVLNISKAVAILLYELSRVSLRTSREKRRLVSMAERESFYEDLKKVLIEIGFLSESNPEHIMNAIRGILNQPELTERDLKILRGIVGQLDWYIRAGRLRSPGDIRKP